MKTTASKGKVTKPPSGQRAKSRKSKPEKYIGYYNVEMLPHAQACYRDVISEDIAFNYSAFYAAVNCISDDVMILPMHVYERIGDGRYGRPDHPVGRLFRSGPNVEMDTPTFIKYLVTMRLAWGNGYAEIVRNMRTGYAEQLIPIHSRRVTPRRTNAGVLYYEVSNYDGGYVQIPADNMLHVRGMSLDGVTGASVVAFARESIGIGLTADRHAHQFFGNSARPGMVITSPRRIGMEEEKNLRQSLERYNATGSRYGVMALEEGFTLKEIGMPHADAQFLETRLFQIQEISRWFRLAPNKLGDYSRAKFANLEESNIQHVNDAILPEVVRLESELVRKLVPDPAISGEDVVIKFSLAGLLRGNSQARAAHYKVMIDAGILSINEVRALEEFNPIPDGDKHRVPMNTVPVEDEPLQNEDEPIEESEPRRDESAISKAVDDAVLDAISRMKRKECKAFRAAIKRSKGVREEFGAWLDEWYARHYEELCETLAPPLRISCLLRGDNIERAIRDTASEEIAKSQDQIRRAMLDGNGEYIETIEALIEQWELLCTRHN